MKTSKKLSRKRRSGASRAKIREIEQLRLCVHRTPQHIYVQIIQPGDKIKTENTDKVLVSASTLEKDVKKSLSATGNKDAAKSVGELIAKRALEKGIKKVAFDRSGFRYHGRVAALADAARESGLEF